MKRILQMMVLACLFLSLGVQTGQSTWLDDWADQKVTTKNSNYSGGNRKYFFGGSFSGRLNMRSEPLMNIQPPRVKIGCGGVDIFMGSFNFMDADYLVEKGKRIISGAAFVAFDVAFKTLNEQLAGSYKDAEAFMERLNALQLDECKASQQLYVAMTTSNNGSEDMGANINKEKITKGGSDNWYELSKNREGSGGKISTSEVDDLLAGCSALAREVFTDQGSVIMRLSQKIGYSAEHAGMIRAIFGDINVDRTEGIKVSYVGPCKESAAFDLDKFVSGKFEIMTAGGTCEPLKKAGGKSLKDWAAETMTQVMQRMRTRGTLSSEETAFLSEASVPVIPVLKMAVGTQMESEIAEQMADLVAKSHSYAMLSDVTEIALQLSNYAKEIEEGNSETPATCKVNIVKTAADPIKEMREKIMVARELMHRQYTDALQEAETSARYFRLMKEFYDEAKVEMRAMVGRNVKARL